MQFSTACFAHYENSLPGTSKIEKTTPTWAGVVFSLKRKKLFLNYFLWLLLLFLLSIISFSHNLIIITFNNPKTKPFCGILFLQSITFTNFPNPFFSENWNCLTSSVINQTCQRKLIIFSIFRKSYCLFAF